VSRVTGEGELGQLTPALRGVRLDELSPLMRRADAVEAEAWRAFTNRVRFIAGGMRRTGWL
jgi:hypothetical protein